MPGPTRPAPTIMLLTLLHSIALLGAASGSQVPTLEPQLPGAIRTADVPASIEITATHFLATSRSNERQWLVFTDDELGYVGVRGLYAFEHALLPIPAGSADGMCVELIARGSDGTLLTSGQMRCLAIEGHPVFLERRANSLVGWVPRHGGRSLTRVTAAPSGCLPLGSSAAPATAAPHVPVPLPSENRKKDKSRPVPKKKLPPI